MKATEGATMIRGTTQHRKFFIGIMLCAIGLLISVVYATSVELNPSGNVTAFSPSIVPVQTLKTTDWSGDVDTPVPDSPEAEIGPPGWSLVVDSVKVKTTSGGSYVDADGNTYELSITGGGTASNGTVSFRPKAAAYWKLTFHTHVGFLDTMGVSYTGDSSPINVTLTAVGVEKIQYSIAGTPMQDASSTIYVLKGKTVAFKAIPVPADASWPSGKAVWGGASGASGTGSTASVTFNNQSSSTSDTKDVTVECGNMVYSFPVVCTVAGNVVPDDNFAGRSTTKFGVAEVLSLSATILPSGVTAANLGGLVWVAQTGNGTLTGTDGHDGSGTYTCYWTNDSAQLALKRLAGGTNTETADSKNETIVAPTGVTQTGMSGIEHTYGSAGLEYKFNYGLTPNDVSFKHISVREGSETYHGSGYFSFMEGHPHNVGVWNSVDAGANSYWATDLHGTSAPYPPPWSTGSYYCDIPIEYCVGTGGANRITSVRSSMSIDAAGTCTTSKGTTGPVTRAVNDGTSGF